MRIDAFNGRKNRIRDDPVFFTVCVLAVGNVGLFGVIPIVVLFDFAAAFPSVAHAWMKAVFRVLTLPRAYCDAVEALHADKQGYLNRDDVF